MLFAYTYVPHKMEKMQEYIDFIFYEVWCKAPGNGGFRIDLFDDNAELKELMEGFYYTDTKGGDFFYSHVQRIYDLFATFTKPQIDQFKKWYQGNNDIENVCASNAAVQIAHYADINAINPDLGEQLATFFKGLYSQQLLDLAALRNKIGQIDDHYQEFMKVNASSKCPFCGLGDIKGVHHSKREAYDHYLPKSIYPFNSINFRNLVPACHECNSTYKISKDPAYNAAGRRKSFYPYAVGNLNIEVNIELKSSDLDRINPNDVDITFGPAAVQEEIETWNEVYSIDERYKAKCCSGDAKDWLEQVRIMQNDHGVSKTAYLTTVREQTVRDPAANSNFLKRAFLEGCNRKGLLDF